MATVTQYTFQINAFNSDQFTQIISQSSISTALDHINTNIPEVDIFFKDVLSSTDQTTLNSLVSSYVYAVNPTIVPAFTILSQPNITTEPFAAKTIGTKHLYKRVSGIQYTTVVGLNTFTFTIPYNWAKITGVEFINGEALDIASLLVLDTSSGQFSGTANAALNQFGFNVNISKDYYLQGSEYDADLYVGMQIQIQYTSISAKTLGINFILNEVK